MKAMKLVLGAGLMAGGATQCDSLKTFRAGYASEQVGRCYDDLAGLESSLPSKCEDGGGIPCAVHLDAISGKRNACNDYRDHVCTLVKEALGKGDTDIETTSKMASFNAKYCR